jgi:hypothetical protein
VSAAAVRLTRPDDDAEVADEHILIHYRWRPAQRPAQRRPGGRPRNLFTQFRRHHVGLCAVMYQRRHGCPWKCAWGHARDEFGVGLRLVREAASLPAVLEAAREIEAATPGLHQDVTFTVSLGARPLGAPLGFGAQTSGDERRTA